MIGSEGNMIYRVLSLVFVTYLFLGSGKIVYTQADPNFKEMFFGDIRRSSSYVMGLEKLESKELLCIQSKSSLVSLFSNRKSKYTFSIIRGLNFEQTRSLKLKGEGKFTNFLNYAPLHLL